MHGEATDIATANDPTRRRRIAPNERAGVFTTIKPRADGSAQSLPASAPRCSSLRAALRRDHARRRAGPGSSSRRPMRRSRSNSRRASAKRPRSPTTRSATWRRWDSPTNVGQSHGRDARSPAGSIDQRAEVPEVSLQSKCRPPGGPAWTRGPRYQSWTGRQGATAHLAGADGASPASPPFPRLERRVHS